MGNSIDVIENKIKIKIRTNQKIGLCRFDFLCHPSECPGSKAWTAVDIN